MYNVYDFIAWALSHADPNTILKSSNFPIAKDKIGTEPWHYLYGTVKVHTNKLWLDNRFENYYSTHGWTREEYDKVTCSWLPEDWATDCHHPSHWQRNGQSVATASCCFASTMFIRSSRSNAKAIKPYAIS